MAVKNKKNAPAKNAGEIAVGTSQAQLVWRQFKKNKGAMIGIVILVLLMIATLISPLIWDYDTEILGMNPKLRLTKPCWEYPFGTDQMGRDMMGRVLYGARYSLLIGFGATAISAIVGIPLGAIAAYAGGKTEDIIMRLVELLLMIPNMLLTIVIVAITGINLRNLVICFGIATIPHFCRNARAAVMTVMGNEYIEAAKALGVKDWVIIATHILPNALSPILVQATSRIGGCIVGAAGFSFLGLGVPVPTPEWGSMLNEAKGQMRQNPYLVLFPGLAIFITVLAINLIGDGLRDALDPKLKR